MILAQILAYLKFVGGVVRVMDAADMALAYLFLPRIPTFAVWFVYP